MKYPSIICNYIGFQEMDIKLADLSIPIHVYKCCFPNHYLGTDNFHHYGRLIMNISLALMSECTY